MFTLFRNHGNLQLSKWECCVCMRWMDVKTNDVLLKTLEITFVSQKKCKPKENIYIVTLLADENGTKEIRLESFIRSIELFLNPLLQENVEQHHEQPVQSIPF